MDSGDLGFRWDGLYGPPKIIVGVKLIILVLRWAQKKRFEMNIKIASVTKYFVALTTVALLFASLTWADDKNESDIGKRLDTSAHVLNEIMATPDKAIPDGIMHEAKCIADARRMERPGSAYHHRWQLGTAARRPGGRSGAGGYD
jgi:hypothetical protein